MAFENETTNNRTHSAQKEAFSWKWEIERNEQNGESDQRKKGIR